MSVISYAALERLVRCAYTAKRFDDCERNLDEARRVARALAAYQETEDEKWERRAREYPGKTHD